MPAIRVGQHGKSSRRFMHVLMPFGGGAVVIQDFSARATSTAGRLSITVAARPCDIHHMCVMLCDAMIKLQTNGLRICSHCCTVHAISGKHIIVQAHLLLVQLKEAAVAWLSAPQPRRALCANAMASCRVSGTCCADMNVSCSLFAELHVKCSRSQHNKAPFSPANKCNELKVWTTSMQTYLTCGAALASITAPSLLEGLHSMSDFGRSYPPAPTNSLLTCSCHTALH